MRYFIIAGEQSGDLHGSNLVRELKRKDPLSEIRCWGGDLMQSAGADLLMHYKKTAIMGFLTIIKHLGAVTRNMILCKKHIMEFQPDVVILIDYAGFNLRIAKFSTQAGFQVYYYISPKLWAWNERRVEKIRKYVDRLYIIFPFETDFYKRHHIEAIYCGNPLLDETERKFKTISSGDEVRKSLGLDNRPVIALLAGSRKSEVELILPVMVLMASHFPDYQFVLAGVKNLSDELYNKIIGDIPVRLIKEKTYEILSVSDAALVTSGTATLETALLNIPEVVCYRGDLFSMLIAWAVIKVKYISLVNLIVNQEIVKELIQFSLTEKSLMAELKAILPGGEKREKMLSDYQKLREIIGPSGASERVAGDMVKSIMQEKMKM